MILFKAVVAIFMSINAVFGLMYLLSALSWVIRKLIGRNEHVVTLKEAMFGCSPVNVILIGINIIFILIMIFLFIFKLISNLLN